MFAPILPKPTIAICIVDLLLFSLVSDGLTDGKGSERSRNVRCVFPVRNHGVFRNHDHPVSNVIVAAIAIHLSFDETDSMAARYEPSRLEITFSNLTISAENLRIPSAVLSTAIGSSLNSKRKVFSSREISSP